MGLPSCSERSLARGIAARLGAELRRDRPVAWSAMRALWVACHPAATPGDVSAALADVARLTGR